MFLFLVHHADALAPDVDPQRPLSPKGRQQALSAASQAAARGAKPAVIWHSGKLRARQTAEAYWRACNPLAEMSALHGIQPNDPPAWVRDRLLAEDRDVMLVGHLPHLPLLLRLLLGRDPNDAAIQFPSNGAVALERDGEKWVERWRVESQAAEG